MRISIESDIEWVLLGFFYTLRQDPICNSALMNLIPSFISCRKAAKSNIYNKQLDVCLDPKNVVNTLFSYVEDGTTR